MSDYSFLRSGFGEINNSQQQKDLLRKIVALLKVLMNDAVQTAEKFVKVCGRRQIRGKDISLALQYEAHEFLQQENLEAKFESVLR